MKQMLVHFSDDFSFRTCSFADCAVHETSQISARSLVCFLGLQLSVPRDSMNFHHCCMPCEERLGMGSLLAILLRLNWPSALYGPTLSGTQVLRERSSLVRTKRF
jgi:hypothetical protein